MNKQLSLFQKNTPYDNGEVYIPLANIYGSGYKITPYRETKENGMKELLPLEDYDYIMVGFSGGKDSISAVLYLLELGVPREKIVLIHHLIDGENNSNRLLMDWPVTKVYCQQFADFMRLTIRYSWREGGFLGEILRLGSSNPIVFEEFENGELTKKLTDKERLTEVLRGELEKAIKNQDEELKEKAMLELKKLGYRFKFPAKSPSLTTRWCSSALKIEVFNRFLRYASLTEQNCKILFVDGIRRMESSNRSKYNEIETNSCTALTRNRIIHTWRAVIEWSEEMVWNIMEKYHIAPHPCYRLGWSRCSCAMCIFSMPCHFKGISEVLPDRFKQLKKLENELGFTLDNKRDLDRYIEGAVSCISNRDEILIRYIQEGFLPKEYIYMRNWELPAGAFHGSEGGPC